MPDVHPRSSLNFLAGRGRSSSAADLLGPREGRKLTRDPQRIWQRKGTPLALKAYRGTGSRRLADIEFRSVLFRVTLGRNDNNVEPSAQVIQPEQRYARPVRSR